MGESDIETWYQLVENLYKRENKSFLNMQDDWMAWNPTKIDFQCLEKKVSCFSPRSCSWSYSFKEHKTQMHSQVNFENSEKPILVKRNLSKTVRKNSKSNKSATYYLVPESFVLRNVSQRKQNRHEIGYMIET